MAELSDIGNEFIRQEIEEYLERPEEIERNIELFARVRPAMQDIAAALIEGDDDIGCLGVEVSGRVVEGEMTVFADAGETYVDGVGLDLFVERLADFFGGAALGFDIEGIL